VTLPRTCALTSTESKGAHNPLFGSEVHGASRIVTFPRACAFASPESTEKVQDLQFIYGEHGTSRKMTPPRTCAIESCDIMMPIHGSRDVQHDDASHHDAPFINHACRDASYDVFYDSSREGGGVRG
jgi:hypothetical protein